MQRSAGILLPVSSLPSKYGIGTFGKSAYDFVDFLEASGMRWWQMLPLGPTSYGDSPYASFSTFAGNPYFIDLEMLIADGLLTEEECDRNWGTNPSYIDYGKIYESRFDVLRIACNRLMERAPEKVAAFRAENSRWLPNYALYMAVKRHFGMKSWTEWPDEGIRLHRADAIARYNELLKEDIAFFEAVQYLFFAQWDNLRTYATKHGVGIIGDLPIYVAMDSADVWSEPEFFQLDENGRATDVSGVPPDAFTADGQLWGNPLYNWDRMREDGYGWWIRRVDGAAKLFDVIRIDHFRGLDSYWAVPAGETTAKNGHWVQGPGIDFVSRALTGWFPNLSFIAEDLGYQTPSVKQLLADSKMPGMKVLEFAFDSREPGDYLPHNYDRNCVCYTGTHDNVPVGGWFEEADPADIEMAEKYLGLSKKEGYIRGMIRGGMTSVADLFVMQMQDALNLGAESRINTPGTSSANWQWRMDAKALTAKLAKELRLMVWRTSRLPEGAEKEFDLPVAEKPKKAPAKRKASK
ncbi:MAG: 4-alpha-glucanotransferase [Clostridia bacterium]|nr:4-alpha-glucanotransferase [Clostridia bacterium]